MPGDRAALLARFQGFAFICFDAALLLDEGLVIEGASPQAEALHGAAPGTLLGLSFPSLCAPGLAADTGGRLAALRPGDRAHFTCALLTRIKETAIEVNALGVEAEGARGLLVALRAVEPKRPGEAWLRLAVEESPDSIYLSRLADYKLVEANEAFVRHQGGTREEVLERSTLELGLWANPEERQAVVERLRRDGVVHQQLVHTGLKDGTVAVSSYSARKVELDGVEHILSITRDVTGEKALAAERKRLASRVDEQDELRERILETMQEGIRVLDLEGRILFLNARYGEILGIPHQTMTGRRYTDFVPAENVGFAERMHEEVMQGRRISREFPHRLPDGRIRYLSSSLCPLRDAGGLIFGSLGVLFDVTERKSVEDRLSVERERLAVTLQSIGEAVIATDERRQVMLMNGAAERLTGWTAAEAVGRPLAEVFRVIDEDSRQPLQDPAARDLNRGGTARLSDHSALITRDGREISIGENSAPIRGLDGKILGAVLVFRDQAAERTADRIRREGEERLARSEHLYRLLADHTLDVIWRLDLTTLRFAYVSPSVFKLSGHTPEEFMALSLEEILTPGSLSEVQSMLHTVGTPLERDSYTAVVEERCRDGSVKNVEITASLIRDPAGRSVEVVGVSRDATARIVAEEALRKSEGRFRALIENSTDLIMVLDAENRIQFWSPSATQCLGWRPEEVLGKRPQELQLVHPDDLAELEEANRMVATRALPSAQIRARHRHRDGSWRLIQGTGRNLLDDPAVRGVVVNARDITDQERLAAQYLQAQKLESIGRLAGGVAHDFNNLLTVILSCADALRDDLAERAPASLSDVEQILASSWRARDLTRHLLAFARKQVVTPVRLDLGSVVTSSEGLLRRLLGEEVRMVVERAADAWAVFCDPIQVELALMNLVVNARDAMPGGGTLTLSVENVAGDAGGNDRVVVFVRDTGVGMSDEVRSHLFEPFFTTKEPGKGTGLGLATVYGIVSQCGGTVRVESRPGGGSTFELSFPRVLGPEAPARVPPSALARPAVGTEQVLVVEDDPQVRAVTVRTLAGAGYRLLVASNGPEALQMARREDVALDLVVTDVVMPGMSGRELVLALRLERPGLRALYVSGYAKDAIARHGVLDEGIEFLPKPFTPGTLLASVRAVLDAREKLAKAT